MPVVSIRVMAPKFKDEDSHFSNFCIFDFLYLQQLKDEIAEVTAEMESLDNTGEERYVSPREFISHTHIDFGTIKIIDFLTKSYLIVVHDELN